tara:strand:- start:9679 stop:9945 length:267 start_codon:yes stop_codon:yes gene_type:complete
MPTKTKKRPTGTTHTRQTRRKRGAQSPLSAGSSRPVRSAKGINSCWKGYEAIGMKKKGKRLVPNCVPKKTVSSRIAKKKKASKTYQGK